MRIVLKYDENQPRDERGRFGETSGDSGSSKPDPVGGSKPGTINFDAPRSATIKPLTSREFRKLDPDALSNTVSRVLRSPGGNTIQGVYAHIALAYGQAPSKEFASKVDSVLKEMHDRGLFKVEKEPITQRHGKDVEDFTLSGKVKAGSVKWGVDKTTGEFFILEREQFVLKPTDMIPPNIAKVDVPIHTLGVERPDRFDPVPNSLAQKALDYRRETYPDTRMSPMGRYFSSSKDSPEMMLGDEKQADNKFNRNEYFGKKGIYFYDATSSVTAHVGAMTGDVQSLTMSKLIPGTEKPAHHQLAQELGIKAQDTTKPYYTTLSNPITGKTLDIKDFEGVTDKHELKKAFKAIWTPGSYGSRAQFGKNFGPEKAMGNKVQEHLVKAGMKPEAAKATTQKMLDNFKETAMFQFTPKFKDVISEAPANFVYTNPMSGFRMSFNEYNTVKHTVTLGKDRVSIRIPSELATNSKGELKRGSAAPLFIQNWDAAVIGQLMKDMKSPYTAHDAIGIKKAYQKDLNKSVAKAMNMVKNFNPIKDLADQIMKQHLKNGMSKKEYKAMRDRLNKKVYVLTEHRGSVSDFVPNKDVGNNHFQPEF